MMMANPLAIHPLSHSSYFGLILVAMRIFLLLSYAAVIRASTSGLRRRAPILQSLKESRKQARKLPSSLYESPEEGQVHQPSPTLQLPLKKRKILYQIPTNKVLLSSSGEEIKDPFSGGVVTWGSNFAELVKKDGFLLRHVPLDLSYNTPIYNSLARYAIMKNPLALQHVSDISGLKGLKAFVQIAVNADGRALQFADEKLRADYNTVLSAVKNDGMALQWAAPALRASTTIVEAAMKQNRQSYYFAAPEVQANVTKPS